MSDWTESLRKLRSDPIRQHWETASSRLTDALNNASVDELTRFAAMLKLSDDERDWDLETDSETSGSDIGALYQDDYTGDSEEEYLEDTDMGGTDWEYPQEEATSCQYPHSEAQSNLDKALGDSGSLTNLDIHDNRSDTNTLEELMRAWGHFFNNPQVRPTETGRQATLMGGSSPLLTNSGVQYDAADSVDSGPNPSHDVKYNVRLLDTDNLARLPAASFEHTPSSTILENIQDIQGDTKAIMMQIEDVGTVEHVENVESQMPSGIQEEFGSSHHVEHVEYAKNSSDEDQCSSSAADPMEELRDELTNQCIDVVRWYRTTRRLPPEDTEINAGYIYWAWLVLKDIDSQEPDFSAESCFKPQKLK
ncbi:uncharacterized protein CTRU02_211588 [Colletotrichum truncatum]|uniref:Uncharacterized protein n=1 Tax=Colletotrichum truncatum TaxID=5467 RepID=A0ACC3YL43_COLTU|nr:uncharacterized protein CTRU02_14095 [Colletotrichum truncatum]KAF6782614.1 hypothetical protein CTRU02_14095 [Colletotrichum truncatum]